MSINNEFAGKLLALAEIGNNAYWVAVKQEPQDVSLLKVLTSIREQLFLECKKIGLDAKQQDPLIEIKSDFLSKVGFAFQGNQEKQRQRGVVYENSHYQFLDTAELPQQKPIAKFGLG